MDPQFIWLRAIVRQRTRADRKARYLASDAQRELVAGVLGRHLQENETFTVYQGSGDGIRIQIASATLVEDFLADGGRARGDDWDHLCTVIQALTAFEHGALKWKFRIEAIVLVRPLSNSLTEALADGFDRTWRGMLAEQVSEDAWLLGIGRFRLLRETAMRRRVDDARAVSHVRKIVERAFISPPPSRPLSPPRPDEVTLLEITDAYRAAVDGRERMRLVSDKPWRDLFHEEGDIRIGPLVLTLFKRDAGARGTISARHDDGRSSNFERLRAMGPDPLHVIDGEVFDRLCGLLEALEPESGT
jgi:hypothetical protein